MGAVTTTENKTILGGANGAHITKVTITGPASYDTGGSSCDWDTFDGITISELITVKPAGVLHVDGAAYVTHYINSDYTDPDGGVLYYEDGGTQVANATDLSAANKKVILEITWR